VGFFKSILHEICHCNIKIFAFKIKIRKEKVASIYKMKHSVLEMNNKGKIFYVKMFSIIMLHFFSYFKLFTKLNTEVLHFS